MNEPAVPEVNGQSNVGKPSSNQPSTAAPVAWTEIFSQHESNLTRHIEICSKVQKHVPPGEDSFRAISSIIHETEKLVGDLDKLRTEFMSPSVATNILSGRTFDKVNKQRTTAARDSPDYSNEQKNKTPPPRGTAATKGGAHAAEQSPLFVFDKKPTPVALPQRLKNGKKRSWDDDDSVLEKNYQTNAPPKGKRAKLLPAHPDVSGHGPSGNAPGGSSTAMVEVEDISDEVEARLKIREENRRKRKEKPQRKRKRSSSASRIEAHGPENGDSQKRKRFKPVNDADRKTKSRGEPQGNNTRERGRKRGGAGTVEQGGEEREVRKRPRRTKNA